MWTQITIQIYYLNCINVCDKFHWVSYCHQYTDQDNTMLDHWGIHTSLNTNYTTSLNCTDLGGTPREAIACLACRGVPIVLKWPVSSTGQQLPSQVLSGDVRLHFHYHFPMCCWHQSVWSCCLVCTLMASSVLHTQRACPCVLSPQTDPAGTQQHINGRLHFAHFGQLAPPPANMPNNSWNRPSGQHVPHQGYQSPGQRQWCISILSLYLWLFQIRTGRMPWSRPLNVER